jgi:hypothetical protein
MQNDSLHSTISKHDLLLWIREMGIASTRQLRKAMNCRTWRQEERFRQVIGCLLRSGQLHRLGDEQDYGDEILSVVSHPDVDVECALGATDLKIAIMLSCSQLGYTHWHLGGSTTPAILTARRGDDRRVFALEYSKTDAVCEPRCDVLREHWRIVANTSGCWDSASGLILVSYDQWPLGRSRGWLKALVNKIDDDRLFVTNHVLLLDTGVSHVLTNQIWYRSGQDAPVAVIST